MKTTNPEERKLATKGMLKTVILKQSVRAFTIAAAIPIIGLVCLAVSFSSHSVIAPTRSMGFVCSLAAGIALHASFLGASRRWYILAIEVPVVGVLFKPVALM